MPTATLDATADLIKKRFGAGGAADKPEPVWVIGRGVGRALIGLPGIDPGRIICQPQSRDGQRYQEDLRRLVSEVVKVVGAERPGERR
jgi:hypothetical protein